MGNEVSQRDRLLARIALLSGIPLGVNAAWDEAEAFVAALEAEPDKSAKCPCCDKSVQLCLKHYQLHEPGKKCSGCREDE